MNDANKNTEKTDEEKLVENLQSFSEVAITFQELLKGLTLSVKNLSDKLMELEEKITTLENEQANPEENKNPEK